MSLLGAEAPGLPALLDNFALDLLWHPSLSERSGQAVIDVLAQCTEGRQRLDFLCVEGALLRGPNGSGQYQRLSGQGEALYRWVERLARQARHVLAVGSCAAFGGVCAAGANPTEASGLQFEGEIPGGLLGSDFRAGNGLPVINIAGCPIHPSWLAETLIALVLGKFDARDLDALNRPRFYTDHLVHHGCPRNEFYEFKASAEKPSDLGCLMENLGCKGTQAHADCNVRLWNGEGSCNRGGYPCINCTAPGFEEPGHPFVETHKVAGIPTGLPLDMPKAWFVALAALSKSATPRRVRENATADHARVTPAIRKGRHK